MTRFRHVLPNAARAIDQYGRPYITPIGPREFDPDGYLIASVDFRSDEHGRYLFRVRRDLDYAINTLREAGYIL